MQASQNEYDLDGDDDDDDDHFNDDNGDGDDEHDGSLSGSDDNEKGSWSGSNNGNDSINGDTSGDGTASTASNNSGSHNAPSSSGSSRSHNSSGSGSGSGSDSPTPKHAAMDWGKTEQAPCIFNYGSKTSGGFKPNAAAAGNTAPQLGVAYPPRPAGSKKSQSVESYNHGGVVLVNEEANAVEKANYLGYSQQQAQDKRSQTAPAAPVISAPSTTVSSSSSHEMSATLAAAEYYHGMTKHEQTLSSGWQYPSLRPIASAVAAPTLPQHCTTRVPNILLSVIPQGVLSAKSAGGVSPMGSVSPDDAQRGWDFASASATLLLPPSKANSTGSNSSVFGGCTDAIQCPPSFTKDSGSFRNLPSSNIANANSPL